MIKYLYYLVFLIIIMTSVDEKLEYIKLSITALFKLKKFKKNKSRWIKEDKGIRHIFEMKFNKWDTEERANIFLSAGFSKGEVKKVSECLNQISLENRQVFISTHEKEMAAEIVAEIENKVLPKFELADEHYYLNIIAKEIFEYAYIRIAAFLKENGFVKDGSHWEKYKERITYMIVPGLINKDLVTKAIAVSIGVFDLDFHIKYQGGSESSESRMSLCQKRYRKTLSELKRRPRGSYEIKLSTNRRKLTKEIIDDIKHVAFPWFEKYPKK